MQRSHTKEMHLLELVLHMVFFFVIFGYANYSDFSLCNVALKFYFLPDMSYSAVRHFKKEQLDRRSWEIRLKAQALFPSQLLAFFLQKS